MHHRPAHHPASEFAGRTSFILRKYNEIYFSLNLCTIPPKNQSLKLFLYADPESV